jgi:prophage regulatory protein
MSTATPPQATTETPHPTTPMTKAQVCERLQLSPRALEMAVRRGDFPPAVRIGKRVFWSPKAVDAWRETLFRQQENWEPDH